MAKKYLEKLTKLFEKINSKKIDNTKFEIKHFFNGAAVYVNKKICISLSQVGSAIKLPEKLRNELMKEKGTKPLCYFSKGHIKKEYVILPRRMINDKKLLRQLIKKRFEYIS